jgi:hypothetical protein
MNRTGSLLAHRHVLFSNSLTDPQAEANALSLEQLAATLTGLELFMYVCRDVCPPALVQQQGALVEGEI